MNLFKALRRPNLLIRAARIGVESYRRERDLRRLLRTGRIPPAQAGLQNLLTLEEELETNRQAGDSTYSITRHVEVLTALIAEASLFQPKSPSIT